MSVALDIANAQLIGVLASNWMINALLMAIVTLDFTVMMRCNNVKLLKKKEPLVPKLMNVGELEDVFLVTNSIRPVNVKLTSLNLMARSTTLNLSKISTPALLDLPWMKTLQVKLTPSSSNLLTSFAERASPVLRKGKNVPAILTVLLLKELFQRNASAFPEKQR